MKKPIAAVLGAFLLVLSSSETVAQATVKQGDMKVASEREQELCTKTGGYVFTAAADAVGAKVPFCRCAQGLIYHFPSGGCVKPGA
jgi:hypothetical protein